MTLPRRSRVLLAAPPLLMATAVVVTGNHYIIDAIAGITLALFGLYVAHRRDRQSGARVLAGDGATALRDKRVR